MKLELKIRFHLLSGVKLSLMISHIFVAWDFTNLNNYATNLEIDVEDLEESQSEDEKILTEHQ